MNITFYKNSNGSEPVKGFIDDLQSKDKSKVLACLKSIEELGFDSPRVEFRQIHGRLWEIKIRTSSIGVRIFYVGVKKGNLVLLHAYKKESQKAPNRDIKIAEQRMNEVMHHEKDYA